MGPQCGPWPLQGSGPSLGGVEIGRTQPSPAHHPDPGSCVEGRKGLNKGPLFERSCRPGRGPITRPLAIAPGPSLREGLGKNGSGGLDHPNSPDLCPPPPEGVGRRWGTGSGVGGGGVRGVRVRGKVWGFRVNILSICAASSSNHG